MDFQGLSDEELVMRCKQGHEAAWSVLVRRFQRLVYTIPRRLRLPEQAVADVFQTTFSRLFEHIDRLDDPSRVRAWLVTTARREGLKLLREAERERVPASALADVADLAGDSDGEAAQQHTGAIEEAWGFAAPGGEPTEEERWHEVRTAVDRLDARCRQLIEMLFLSDPEVPYAEIGRRLGMPPGSIGPTRARCLAQLRKLLSAG